MAVLCVLVAAVCLMDYRRTRIPNRMILLIFLYGLGYRYWDAGGGGAADFLINCILVLLLLYPLFKIGAVGAGDVKLFSVTAGCLSRQEIPCFLVSSLLIAALISLIKICRERNGRERFFYLCAYLTDVCRTGHFSLYLADVPIKRAGVCLAGPVFLSLLLHMGGVY